MAEIYDDIVVATTTNMVKTYLECRAAKEASQQASMLKLSIPKSKEHGLTQPPLVLAMTDDTSATKGKERAVAFSTPLTSVPRTPMPHHVPKSGTSSKPPLVSQRDPTVPFRSITDRSS